MNNPELNGSVFSFNSNKSIFPDGRIIDWKSRTNIFSLLGDVFAWLGEKSRTKLYLRHSDFQSVLLYYSFDEDLKTFLERNGFLMLQVFDDLEDLKRFVLSKGNLRTDIKLGKVNIGILFDGFVPVGVVLAKKLESDEKINKNIELLIQDFARRISEIPELKDLIL